MPVLNSGRSSVLKKQIPTVVGMLVLVLALGVGLFFFSGGLGVFAPRATPQTTPKNIKITNVTDTGFSVSFLTDETAIGFIKYGTTSDDLETQTGDDRDQLSGTVGEYATHHITVRNLQPGTSYFFTIGTGSGAEFNNQGAPFTVATAPLASGTPVAKTIYGNVTTADGRPADGSLVYVTAPDMGELSAVVKGSGSWAAALGTARTTDLRGYAVIEDSTLVTINIQGVLISDVAQASVTVAEAQPAPTLALGQGTLEAAADRSLEGTNPLDLPDSNLSADTLTDGSDSSDSSLSYLPSDDGFGSTQGGGLGDLLDSSSSGTVAEDAVVTVDLTNEAVQTVETSQPIISGVAAPNVLVTIEVHSENQVNQEVVTDENGNFVFDLSSMETELEPGEHTVTYSYVDPATGENVTKTQTFWVEGDESSTGGTLLAEAETGASNSGTQNAPFGSGNPFPIPSPTPTATPVSISSPSATATKSATPSGRTSRPSTQSGVPVSGSTGTTIALLGGGLFFILAGVWSYWVAQQVRENA